MTITRLELDIPRESTRMRMRANGRKSWLVGALENIFLIFFPPFFKKAFFSEKKIERKKKREKEKKEKKVGEGSSFSSPLSLIRC